MKVVDQLDVEVGDAAHVMSEPAPIVDVCRSAPDICESGKTPSVTVLAGRSPPMAPNLAMPTVAAVTLSIVKSLEERLCHCLQATLIL